MQSRGTIPRTLSKILSNKLVLGLAFLIISGIFYALGTASCEAKGFTPSRDRQSLKTIYEDTEQAKRDANWWAEQRLETYSPATQKLHHTHSVDYARFRLETWQSRVLQQRTLTEKWMAKMKPGFDRCKAAGSPKSICIALVVGAKQAGVPLGWAHHHGVLYIVKQESGFRPCVRNGGKIDCYYRGSSAWGMFQFLGSTWGLRGVNERRSANPVDQSRAGLKYIKAVYGSPDRAYRVKLATGVY